MEAVIDQKAARRIETAAAIQGRRTLVDRWANAAKIDKARGTSGLDGRAKQVARFVPENSRVVDIGASGGRLERFLPAGCAYQPIDVVKVDPRTIVVDLNREPLPAIKADVAMVIGVLEYIHDVPAFLTRLAELFPKVVTTYYPFDLDPGRDRVGDGWFNSMCRAELRFIAKHAGFQRLIEHPSGRYAVSYEMFRD